MMPLQSTIIGTMTGRTIVESSVTIHFLEDLHWLDATAKCYRIREDCVALKTLMQCNYIVT